MSISGRQVGRLLREWGQNLVPTIFGPTALISGALTILGFFGLRIEVLPQWLPWLLAVGTVGWIAWASKPRGYLHPGDNLNKRLTISELDHMLTEVPRIGLMGSSSVGKSTFLSRAGHLETPNRETEAPYAVIVAAPDRRPTKYLALVDTVGREYPSAAQIMSTCDAVIVFLDNSAASDDETLRNARVQKHKDIVVSNISPSLAAAPKCRFVLVLANKADLWENDERKSQRMAGLAAEIRGILSEMLPGKAIGIIEKHSNLRSEDVTRALRLVEGQL